MQRAVTTDTLLYTIGMLTVQKDAWETEAAEQQARAEEAEKRASEAEVKVATLEAALAKQAPKGGPAAN